MNEHPRIKAEHRDRLPRRPRFLAPAGWATVYTLALFMTGVLIYYITRSIP